MKVIRVARLACLVLTTGVLTGCGSNQSAPMPAVGSCIYDPTEVDGTLIDYFAVKCGTGRGGLKVLFVGSVDGKCPSDTTDQLFISEESGPITKLTMVCTRPE